MVRGKLKVITVMTKEQLQQEIKEKVKPGVKPSEIRSSRRTSIVGDQLKKLKRSKSVSDIPNSNIPVPPPPPQSIPLTKSQSNPPFTDTKYPYTTLISQQQEIDQLTKESQAKSTTIALLRARIEKLEKNPPTPLLQDQLKEKQKQIEDLRKKLEESQTELDNSLFARQEANKQFAKIHTQLQSVRQELAENVDQASNELISQDDLIGRLRSQKTSAQLKIKSLERDLNLSQRLAELRKDSPFSYDDYPDLSYLKYGLYSLMAGVFLL